MLAVVDGVVHCLPILIVVVRVAVLIIVAVVLLLPLRIVLLLLLLGLGLVVLLLLSLVILLILSLIILLLILLLSLVVLLLGLVILLILLLGLLVVLEVLLLLLALVIILLVLGRVLLLLLVVICLVLVVVAAGIWRNVSRCFVFCGNFAGRFFVDTAHGFALHEHLIEVLLVRLVLLWVGSCCLLVVGGRSIGDLVCCRLGCGLGFFVRVVVIHLHGGAASLIFRLF